MSDKILKALMQLFAIIANADRLTAEGRNIVERFLKQQLSTAHVETYLKIFDEYLGFLQGKSDPGKIKKRVSVNSVKILRICADINTELDQKQKYIVLIRLIEFAHSSGEDVEEQEQDFLITVADSFNISKEEFDLCCLFVTSLTIHDSIALLQINNLATSTLQYAKHIQNETLQGAIWILNIKSAAILFAKYFGDTQLNLNGQPLVKNRCYVFTQGSVIRGTKLMPVYYSDVIRSYWTDTQNAFVTLTARNVEYHFKGGKQALHSTSFIATSGNLVGIMGGSGAGKSTMLNILNSTYRPTKGEVLINGINIHSNHRKTEGVIGYVPQDDLLMENLTVSQNLFYNSKLCFGDWSDEQIQTKADQLLHALGLYEARDLKVGDALENIISGGQRKRLNIALELIREPAVLFVDEPTSGLSSRDSENVMDLLKQLSISGKLVFVVIHQPSSDIFKLFDKLLILDIGGYPIYFGNPSDSLLYFKRKANYADADESECLLCGNINPEEVFSIIESRVVDEFGNPTKLRKISPTEWNQHYKEEFNTNSIDSVNQENIEKGFFKKPTWLKQLGVFIQRDVLSKWRDTQYLLINLLEAPALALILAYSIKYHEPGADYIFRDNANLPAYIFMSVIVALFMGLTVSAEEIIRDRKILKRESFLNLSRSSYLLSKIIIMFFLSFLQTALFVFIGNTVFGIQDLYLDYWLVLFSVSCFSNLVGLNISGAFDSAVTIYILIPFLVIPQMILSGVLVKFDQLNPTITSQRHVPVIGEMMTARWAFEALTVNQYKNNAYEKIFFEVDKEKENAFYQRDFWLSKMSDKLERVNRNSKTSKDDFVVLKRELTKELAMFYGNDNGVVRQMETVNANPSSLNFIEKQLIDLRKRYTQLYNEASNKKDAIVSLRMKTESDKLELLELQKKSTNQSLSDLLNKNIRPIVELDKSIVRHYKPVYMDGEPNSFIRAQFYVSRKNVFGHYYDTYKVNVIVIWLMTLMLALTLYFNVLTKIIKGTQSLFSLKIKK